MEKKRGLGSPSTHTWLQGSRDPQSLYILTMCLSRHHPAQPRSPRMAPATISKWGRNTGSCGQGSSAKFLARTLSGKEPENNGVRREGKGHLVSFFSVCDSLDDGKAAAKKAFRETSSLGRLLSVPRSNQVLCTCRTGGTGASVFMSVKWEANPNLPFHRYGGRGVLQ